jgi:hypothetical protein
VKIQTPKLVQVGDVEGAPSWMGKFLKPLYQTLETLVGALQKGLSAKDNLNAEVRELQVLDNVEFELKLNTLKGLPRHMVISQVIEPDEFADLKWRIAPASGGDGAVVILATVKLHSGTQEQVRIRVRIEGD